MEPRYQIKKGFRFIFRNFCIKYSETFTNKSVKF